MTIFSLRHRRMRLASALTLLIPGALAFALVNATAGLTPVKVDRQAYHWDDATLPDPYAASGDSHLHVAVANQQTEAHTLVHLDFANIPSGSQINELNLTMVQLSDQPSDVASAQTQQPGLRACVLLQTFTASETGVKYDCDHYPTATGNFDSKKSTWTFDLQPLAAAWDKLGNTGAAIVPKLVTPPGTSAPDNAVNWSITLDQAQSKAAVDYSPGSVQSSSNSGPVPVSGYSSGLALAAPPLPVTVPPAPKVAPPPAASAQTGPRAPVGVVPLSRVQTSKVWVGIAAGLVALALLLVIGGAALNLLRAGRLSLAGIGGAVSASWPQVATPAAVILAAAVIAGGFSGRLVTVGVPGSASAGATVGQNGAIAGANGVPGTAGGAAGSTTGASGAATGSTASAGASGASTAGMPQGVTPTTVKIGFFHAQNANALNEAQGISGINNVGNDVDQANAMVDWINKHGGLAGHRVIPVFVNVDSSNTDPNYPQQLCKQMTEDEKVFAVVSGGHTLDQEVQCYFQHHTMLVNDGLSFYSEQFLLQMAPYFWQPEMMNIDRAETATLNALNQKGFFTSGSVATTIKVGLLFPNAPSTEAAVKNLVIPALERDGVPASNIDTAEVDYYSGDEAAALSQINSAALKFKVDNVNRVLFPNDIGAAQYLFFARDAENESYAPKYGLNSQDGLDAIGYLLPEDQKAGSVSIGWWPWADTSQANSMGFPDSPAEANCYHIMNEHGIYSSQPKGHERDGEGTLQMEGYCDDLLLLYYGSANLGQALNADNIAANIDRLGTSYQTSVTYPNATVMGPRHHDGTDEYRYIVFDPSCTTGFDGGTGSRPQGCFKYADSSFYRAPEV